MHLVAGNLDEHERLILIEARRGNVRFLEITFAELAARTCHEVVDPPLWLEPFVDVVVTGEHDVHAVLHEQGLEQHAEVDVGSMPPGVAVERMMEVHDFPRFARLLQRGLRPRELRRIQYVRVQHDESDVLSNVGVVPPPLHVDRRIVDGGDVVMVPQRGLKDDAGIEQRPVRPLELLFEVGRLLRAVEVVAEHQHQVVGKLLVDQPHLLGDLVLRLLARAVVADDRKFEGVRVVGQG